MKLAFVLTSALLTGSAPVFSDKASADVSLRWYASYNSGQNFNHQLSNFESKSRDFILIKSQPLSDCSALNRPDGSDFDWSAVQTNEMLEECLLRLAQDIGSIERMARWLSEQGFRVSGNYSNGIDNRNVIWAEWITKESRPMPFDPDWSFLRKWYFSSYTYAVSIEYENKKPFRAIAQHQTK